MGAFSKGAPVRVIGATMTGAYRVLVRAGKFSHQGFQGRGRQDGRLFHQWILHHDDGGGDAEAVRRRREADSDRQPDIDIHKGDERPDRRRLVRTAARLRAGARGQDPHSRPRQGYRRLSEPDHSGDRRQRDRLREAAGRLCPLSRSLSRHDRLDVFRSSFNRRLCEMGRHLSGKSPGRSATSSCRKRTSIPAV